jgi:hypothetical protein
VAIRVACFPAQMSDGGPLLAPQFYFPVPAVDSQMSSQGTSGFGGRPPLYGNPGGYRTNKVKSNQHKGRHQQKGRGPTQRGAIYKGSTGHGKGGDLGSSRSGRMGGRYWPRRSLTRNLPSCAGLSGQKRKGVEETPRHGCLSCPRAPENTNSFLIGAPLSSAVGSVSVLAL